jgi:tRNA (guanine26-N2/guanine27-N2)-dimethyltransferase
LRFEFPSEIINEGKIKIRVPQLKAFIREPSEYAPSKAPVFYNPAMEMNRDLATLILQAYQRNMKRELALCEPLAGCGVRSLRLAIEVRGVNKVILNDISAEAAKLAQYNAHLNCLDNKVDVANEDANLLLSRYAAPRKRFDYIDIDPFGSPIPYLDSTLRALRDGGLLALTATDMAPLCGVHPKACLRRYGGKPLRTEYSHELALRLLIGCLASQAAKHDMGVQLLFSYSEYNYVRVYARVAYGAKAADASIQKIGCILHCFSCFHREWQPRITPLREECPECGSKLQPAGPLWLGALWDRVYCEAVENEARWRNLRNKIAIRRLVSHALKELDAPITYYVVDRLCDKFNLPIPSMSKIITELKRQGFQVVATHFSSRGFRTDAPATVVMKSITYLSRGD